MRLQIVLASAALLLSTFAAANDGPSTSAQIVNDSTGLEDCTLIASIKGKGKTEAQVEEDLRQKARWQRADVILVTGKTKKGLKADAYRCRTVRTTSNPEVVRGCEFVESVEIYNSFSSMLGTNNPVKASDLAKKAWLTGADTVMIIDTGDNSGSGEAYYCGSGKKKTGVVDEE